jgi:hypothetical protein
MTVVKITGNTQFINSAANVIPLANTYGGNATSGATSLYLYNSNTSALTITLANSQGSFIFAIPPSIVLILNKVSTDTLACAAGELARVFRTGRKWNDCYIFPQ